MVRKVYTILMIMVLLVTTSGVTVHQHFCSNRLVKTSLFHPIPSCCDKPGCCHNETISMSLKVDFTLEAPAPDLIMDFSIVHAAFEIASLMYPLSESIIFVRDPDPPPILEPQLAIIQSFLL